MGFQEVESNVVNASLLLNLNLPPKSENLQLHSSKSIENATPL